MATNNVLEPHIQATHDKVKQERETLMDHFRKEFGHEPKVDRVLDAMVGPIRRGRGRPKGSKNKPKAEIVGTILSDLGL